MNVMLDSGVRRGSDVLKARALGADFVLAGRALAFAVGAGGAAGAQRAMDILKPELTRASGQVGAPSAEALLSRAAG
ncbi:MAG: alpha-hydroxy-acid oxidizing protein [Pikeienuella sp.]|uniref:alpha-hydroxy-acid oxidizing protein n=1 Tax=Pikeienuella sp. TaxID=2831957 RepID=UPI00391CE861